MKVKYSSIVGILAVLVLVASFVVPAKLAMPEPVTANPGLMEWTPVDTPDSEAVQVKNLFSPIVAGTERGSEINKLLVGNNGTTMYALIAQSTTANAAAELRLRKSTNGGRSWSAAIYGYLGAAVNPAFAAATPDVLVWDIAIAPDNPNIIAAVVSQLANWGAANAGQRVFISADGGDNWDNSQWPPVAPMAPTAGSYISALDISMDYGAREILVGIRDGTGGPARNIWTMKMPGYGGWNLQQWAGTPTSPNPFAGDIVAGKFSPTYNGDSTIVIAYSNNVGTYLATGVHDIAQNRTTWQVASGHVELKNSGSPAGTSPRAQQIITADLEMPSDFSGQSASLRRFYISTDAVNSGAANLPNRGVYRVDDNVVYTLMDTSNTFQNQWANLPNKRIASIAYWGTYASGKLLVGERLGSTCTATVPVWFTDSPTVCPIPCWYPAKKPPTGAAGYDLCGIDSVGYGNAYVVWSPTFAAQGVAYTVTSSASFDGPYAAVGLLQAPSINWPTALFRIRALDESAFSLTRNNGETWNQLSLIDTRIVKLTDVAPSADCTTVYLASVNNGDRCRGFDSVWRSSTNEKVVAPPLPALPIGQIWERVRTSPTALTCNQVANPQSNYAILRLAPDKLDGQVVGWAAGGSNGAVFHNLATGANTRAMAWSPDFGDYWADINPRIAVQDFAFESATIVYVLAANGWVQKLPYTGTAWASTLQNVASNTAGGHTIEAMAADKVLVGNNLNAATPFPAAISTNGGAAFIPMVRPITPAAAIGYHAIFDTDFAKNATIYVGVDAATGLVYRNTAPAGSNNEWINMMTNMAFIGYTGPHESYFGLAQTNNKNVTGQGTLYAAHAAQGIAAPEPAVTWSGVERTLAPLDGIPKPGLEWACLDAAATPFQANNPLFTLEPKSLKLCGCLTQDTNTTLYAIDNDWYSDNHNVARGVVQVGWPVAVRTIGLLWEYTDCVAKKGPKLTMDDGTIIGCDPATGRNQEVNFKWEQLCIANTYQLQIAKDKAFTLQVFGTGDPYGINGVGIVPVDVTSPALVYFSNGAGAMPGITTVLATDAVGAAMILSALECGHTYFWRVRVLDETTNDVVNSPWSDARTFTIKAGFRVTTPYYGPQLLAPDNGCGCACNAPISFSWSPFKETVEYNFELSENADMSSPLVKTAVKTTAYQFTGTAKCNKTYFWRVQASKPAPSEWSAVFSFLTQPEPPKAPPPPPAPETPMWVWVIIAIGAILVIVTLVLIFKTRRV